jgi:DNA-binding IclR family transcriptional regulator
MLDGIKGTSLKRTPSGSNRTSRAPAVARAATILRLLAGGGPGFGVSDIARKVGIVPSTCYHVLRALTDEGLVAFDLTKKTYRMGAGLVTLAREALGANNFSRVVQPHLDRLALTHGVLAIAGEIDNRDRLVVLTVARADNFVSLHVNVGSRFPALTAATGRLVAAELDLSKAEMRRRFQDLRWERPPPFAKWYEEVRRAKLDKVAVDAGRYLRGITVLATVVPKAADGVLRIIALIGLEHQMTGNPLKTLREDLLETAKKVGTTLR